MVTRNRTQPAQPEPAPTVERDVTKTRAPWETDETSPEFTLALTQTEKGRWQAGRTITFRGIDIRTADGAYEASELLDRVDTLCREHLKDLYQRDAAEREEYFRSKESQGGGYGGGYGNGGRQ